ncbi:MAG: SIS domain-containing protein [Bacteroidia bacterium]|nr:SIS domain-containing protein [Bacteroidia bacterium]
MQIDFYKNQFNRYFDDPSVKTAIADGIKLVQGTRRVFFVGNGGSSAICSHMAEDYTKCGGIPSFSFSDPALITCFANDYGYEHALENWLRFFFEPGDLLVAISSSGESKNILNAVAEARRKEGKVLTCSGFKPGNTLSTLGDVNIITPTENYGVVECFHQVALHIILDSLHGH